MKSAEPIKVLAIDDDPDICFYIQEILERNNCVVTLTERGREALRLLLNESFDIVMADVRLPDLDGVSILEHVRLSGSEIPFVLITGFSENEPIISSMRLGAVDYLTKPFTPSDLEKSLRRALDRKKRQDWSRNLYQICENVDLALPEKIQRILLLTSDMLGLDSGCVVRSSGTAHALSFTAAQNEEELKSINAAFHEHLKDALEHIEKKREPSYGESQGFFWAALPLRMHQLVQGAVCFFKSGTQPVLGQDTMRSVLQLTELSISRLLEAEENASIIANQQNLLMASQNLSSLGALASSIVLQVESHLNQISGRTVTVEKLLKTAAPEEATRIQGELRSIGSDVQRIDRIMKSVRSIAQGSPESRSLLCIRSVLDEALELVRCKIQDRPLRLTVGEVPADLHMEGDATKILQVFLILLNNSFDATLGLDHEWIQVDSELSGTTLRISISDSGRSLPAHLQSEVLHPVTHTASGTADAGLGLARQYMEAHHGTLNLDPQSPNTRFVLEFKPLRKVDGQAS
jgi:DNA-binding response OmpR family regulator/signal transduction histidine kinase